MRSWQAFRVGLGLIAVALAMSCVPVLNPLYTDTDLVLDENLEGIWVEEDSSRWQFEKLDGKSYILTYLEMGLDFDPPRDPGKRAKFDAHLVRLGEVLFMDLYPRSYPDEFDMENDLLTYHLVPAHSISRIWIERDAIRIAMLDPEWLDEALTSGEIEVAHRRGEEGVFITATTPELQAFALSIAENSGSLWGDGRAREGRVVEVLVSTVQSARISENPNLQKG